MKRLKINPFKGPEDWFTGDVFADGIRSSYEQSAIGVTHVRFTPCARTAQHTHPHGQILYVTEGSGYVGRRDVKREVIRAGDAVYIEPGEEHWHGASEDRLMSHVAIQESDENGDPVTWLEHVSDEDYSL